MSLAVKGMYSSNQSASIISNKRSCRSCCSRLDDGFRRSVPSACVLVAVAIRPSPRSRLALVENPHFNVEPPEILQAISPMMGAGAERMPATTIREEGDDRFKPTQYPDNRRRGSGDGSRTAGVCPGAADKRPARRAGGRQDRLLREGQRPHPLHRDRHGLSAVGDGGGLNSRIAVWANAVIN